MPAKSAQQQIEELRVDLGCLTILVECLWAVQLAEFPDGTERFDRVAKPMQTKMDEMTIPFLDPAVSDHVAQLYAESMKRLLDRVRKRIESTRQPRPYT